MKNILHLFIVIFIIQSFKLQAAAPEWVNYSSFGTVRAMCEKNGEVWIATLGGLVKYNKQTGQRTYITKAGDGIPSNTVETIKIDDANNIWIGTYDAGIAMYDGKKWITYNTDNSPLPTNAVLGIEIDKTGNVWVGTHKGLAKITKQGWSVYSRANTPEFRFDDVWAIMADEDNGLWVAGDGLYYLKDSTWKDYSADVNIYIYGLSKNTSGDVFVTGNGGVYRFRKNDWGKLGGINDFPELQYALYSVTDAEGKLWVTSNYGLFEYDGEKWTDFSNTSTQKLQVSAICLDAEGKLWAAGLSGICNFSSSKWQNIAPINNSIPENNIKFAVPDRTGNLWVSSSNYLSLYNKDGWQTFTTENSPLPHNFIYHIRNEKPGTIWICTSNGIAKIENNSWQIYNTENSGLASDIITDITFDDAGNKYITHKDGISIMLENDWKQISNPASFAEYELFTICAVDKNGLLWLGTTRGNIYSYKDGFFTRYSKENNTFAGGTVMDLRIDRQTNTVWAGTLGGGLNYFDGTAWHTSNANQPVAISAVLLHFDGHIWSGSTNPASLAQIADGEAIQYYDWKNSPLPQQSVTSLEEDENGNIWIGTTQGLLHYKINPTASIATVKKPEINASGTLFPNPAAANGSTLAFKLGKAAKIQVSIADITSRVLSVQQTQYLPAGDQKIFIDTKHFSSGTYMVKLQADLLSLNFKLIVR